MSTAWYRPGFIPKAIQAWKVKPKSGLLLGVEVWETTCIVTNFREALCSVLINPANPSLSGVSKFPYFPVRGPEPKLAPNKDAHPIMGHVSQWGGMEVGNGMMFAANVVDGLVHQLGGATLAKELESELEKRIRVDEGQAVWTTGVGDYLHLVHTVPPFFSDTDASDSNILLQKCYQNSLQLALSNPVLEKDDEIRIACPLLGAGCRGFPRDEAIVHFMSALSDWTHDDGDSFSSRQSGDGLKKLSLVFGIPSGEVRSKVIEALDSELGHQSRRSLTNPR